MERLVGSQLAPVSNDVLRANLHILTILCGGVTAPLCGRAVSERKGPEEEKEQKRSPLKPPRVV